jgi:hypothetical protein
MCLQEEARQMVSNDVSSHRILRLFFVALHNLLELTLHQQSFVRMGEYFVQLQPPLSPLLCSPGLCAVSVKFFLFGQKIGLHIAVHHTYLQSLVYRDLTQALGSARQPRYVIVGPLAVVAQLKGVAETATDTFETWNNMLGLRGATKCLNIVKHGTVRVQIDKALCTVPVCVVFKVEEVRQAWMLSFSRNYHSHVSFAATELQSLLSRPTTLPCRSEGLKTKNNLSQLPSVRDVNFWQWSDPMPPSPTKNQSPSSLPPQASQFAPVKSAASLSNMQDTSLKLRFKTDTIAIPKHTMPERTDAAKARPQESEENERKRKRPENAEGDEQRPSVNEAPSDATASTTFAKSRRVADAKLGIVIDTTNLQPTVGVRTLRPTSPSREVTRSQDQQQPTGDNGDTKKELPSLGHVTADLSSAAFPLFSVVPSSDVFSEVPDLFGVPDPSEWLKKMDTESLREPNGSQNDNTKDEVSERVGYEPQGEANSLSALTRSHGHDDANNSNFTSDTNAPKPQQPLVASLCASLSTSTTSGTALSPSRLVSPTPIPIYSFIPAAYSSLAHTIRKPEVKWRATYSPQQARYHNNENKTTASTTSQHSHTAAPLQNDADTISSQRNVRRLASPSRESTEFSLSSPDDNQNDIDSEEGSEESDTADNVAGGMDFVTPSETDANDAPGTSQGAKHITSTLTSGSEKSMLSPVGSNKRMGHEKERCEDTVARMSSSYPTESSAMIMLLAQSSLVARHLDNLVAAASSSLSTPPQPDAPLAVFTRSPGVVPSLSPQPSSSSPSLYHCNVPTQSGKSNSSCLQQLFPTERFLVDILQQQVLSCYDMIDEDRHLNIPATETIPLSELTTIVDESVVCSSLARATNSHWPSHVPKSCFLQRAPTQDVVSLVLTSLKPALDTFGRSVCAREDVPSNMPCDSVVGPLSLSQWAEINTPTQKEDTTVNEQSAVEKLSECNLLVGGQDECFAIHPRLLFFWEKAKFEPYAPRKHIVYFVLTPDNTTLIHHVVQFLNQLSTFYELCNFGRHKVAQTTKYPDGVVRVSEPTLSSGGENDAAKDGYTYTSRNLKMRHFTHYLAACRTLAQHIADDSALTFNAENSVVVYLVFPFDVSTQNSPLLYECLTAMWEVLTTKKSAALKFVLQPLFMEHILGTRISSDLVRALAFSIFTKIRRIYVRERHLLYEPAAILAPSLPEDVSSLIPTRSTFHCCYILTDDSQYAALVCTDSQGEFVETRIVRVLSSPSVSAVGPCQGHPTGIIAHIWTHILECFLPLCSDGTTNKQWLLVIGRLGGFTMSELNDWKAVVTSCVSHEESTQHLLTPTSTNFAAASITKDDNKEWATTLHNGERERIISNYISHVALVSLHECCALQLISKSESEGDSDILHVTPLTSTRTAWVFYPPSPITYGPGLHFHHAAYLFVPSPLSERNDDSSGSSRSSFRTAHSDPSASTCPSTSYSTLVLQLHQIQNLAKSQCQPLPENMITWTPSHLLRHIARQYHAFLTFSVYFHLPKYTLSTVVPLPFHFLLAKRLVHLWNKLHTRS